MLTIHDIRQYLLYLYLFSINYEVFDPTGSGMLSLAKVAGALYLASFLGDPIKFISVRHFEKFIRPIFLFYAFYTLMNILNVNFYSSQFIDFPLLNNIILFIVIMNHERYYPKALEKALVFFAIGSISLAIFYYLDIGIENMGGRISLFGDNENTIANRMVISITIILYTVFKNTLKLNASRYLLLLPLPLMTLLIADTGSRKGFIALFICLALFFVFYKAKYLHIKVIIGIIGIFGILYLYDYLMGVEIIAKRMKETTEEGSLGGREQIWINITPLILDNLVVGVGKTGYNLYALKTFGGLKSPHNVILELLAYTGIIGLSLYMYFYLRIFIYTLLDYFKSNFYLGILLFVPLVGILLAGQILNYKLSYIIFALCLSRKFYYNVKNHN